MKIVSVKIQFSEIGVTVIGEKRQKRYFPVALIQEEGRARRKRLYLKSLIADKKSLKAIVSGETYISLLIEGKYNVFDLEGNLKGSVDADEYGKILQINADSFILMKDKTMTLIDDNGEVAGVRELTNEEYNALGIE